MRSAMPTSGSAAPAPTSRRAPRSAAPQQRSTPSRTPTSASASGSAITATNGVDPPGVAYSDADGRRQGEVGRYRRQRRRPAPVGQGELRRRRAHLHAHRHERRQSGTPTGVAITANPPGGLTVVSASCAGRLLGRRPDRLRRGWVGAGGERSRDDRDPGDPDRCRAASPRRPGPRRPTSIRRTTASR